MKHNTCCAFISKIIVTILIFVLVSASLAFGEINEPGAGGKSSTSVKMVQLEKVEPGVEDKNKQDIEGKEPSHEESPEVKITPSEVNAGKGTASSEPEFKTINVAVMGIGLKAKACLKGEDIFLQADADETKDIIASFAGNITWKGGKLTLTKERDSLVLKKDSEEAAVGKEKFIKPLQVIDGKPYINFYLIAAYYEAGLSKAEDTGKYYLDPLITELRLKHNKGNYDLMIRASSPLKVKDFFLREPARYVIDIPNAVLGAEPVKMVHPDAGEIRYGQFTTAPNLVRIVIPLTQEVRVKMNSRMDLREAVISIELPPAYAPGQNFARQQIKSIQVEDLPGDEGVRIVVIGTGPMQYEWHRLREPDNRIFIDFGRAVLGGSKVIENLSDPVISQVRAAQFQVNPLPITRVVLALKEPVDVEFLVGKKAGNQLVVLVTHKKIDPESSILRGVGATGFPLTGAAICIDPGHGGSDPGAMNTGVGLSEKYLTLDITDRLTKILTGWGLNVILTRYDDRDVSYQGSTAREELGARVRVANSMGADLFISIHINASYSSNVNGTSLHYYKQKDKQLADCLLQSVIQKGQRKNQGVRRNRFYVLAHTTMPAALVECCYISNPTEARLLTDPNFRQKLAEGIAEGLRVYLSGKK
ncbi:MAG: N-acetylmuramoyl-L-alanine amidase [Chloroflexi bacterium]|nr:N-acetylmuramoyl-L-alanine amidase [Chloroflexota bacterium]